jgi:hypothetical protein
MTIGKPFKKGQSGNPGGRPKIVAEVKELARAHTGKAIETLVSIMSNPKAAPAARVSAANAAKTLTEPDVVSPLLAHEPISEDNQAHNSDEIEDGLDREPE